MCVATEDGRPRPESTAQGSQKLRPSRGTRVWSKGKRKRKRGRKKRQKRRKKKRGRKGGRWEKEEIEKEEVERK